MASKGGVLAIASIVGVGALLAFAGTAKAAKPGPKASPEEAQKCVANKAERQSRLGVIQQLKGALVDIDAARIEIAMNGGDTSALDAQRANVVGQINLHQNRVKELDALIEACP